MSLRKRASGIYSINFLRGSADFFADITGRGCSFRDCSGKRGLILRFPTATSVNSPANCRLWWIVPDGEAGLESEPFAGKSGEKGFAALLQGTKKHHADACGCIFAAARFMVAVCGRLSSLPNFVPFSVCE